MRALPSLPRPALIALVLALIALAAWADYALSARGVALPLYYLVPIVFAAWAAGWRLGAAATVLSALANFAIDWALADELNNPVLVQVVSLLFFALVLGLVRVGSTLALMLKFYANSRQWRSQLPPSRLAGNLMIVPASQADAPVPDVDGLPGPDYVPLVIEPGGAFGSGSHPTTRMCVALLEQYLPAGARVFDLGCGTGILSLAAARLGAASVLGADIEPEAIRAAKANARLNHLEDKVEFRLGTFDEVLVANAPTPNLQSPFEVTLANILTDVLIDSLRLGLAHTVLTDGYLILSGIKTDERDRLVATLADEQMEVVDEREEEGWRAVVARWKGA
jgi:ribosomal protein L11 methyltransferase